MELSVSSSLPKVNGSAASTAAAASAIENPQNPTVRKTSLLSSLFQNLPLVGNLWPQKKIEASAPGQIVSESSSKIKEAIKKDNTAISSPPKKTKESKTNSVAKRQKIEVIEIKDDEPEVEWKMYPDDVWGSRSQYDIPNGRLICAAATAHCLISLAKEEIADGKKVDAWIDQGVKSYSTIQPAGKLPLDWADVFKDPTIQSVLEKGETYIHSAPSLEFDFKSLAYKPFSEEKFLEIFGSLIEMANENGGKPVIASLVVGNQGVAISETFGLCIQKIGGKITYRLFNSHGTDLSRNEMSGLADKSPARLNCFLKEVLPCSPQDQFNRYFVNLLGTVIKENGKGQIDINLCKLRAGS